VEQLKIRHWRVSTGLSKGAVAALLEALETAVIVSERNGRVVFANPQARKCLKLQPSEEFVINLFTELLLVDGTEIFREIENGKQGLRLELDRGGERFVADLRWMPEADWILTQFVRQEEQPEPDRATQITVQELLQEREITYRNLLAAYLKLQEVNRQKNGVSGVGGARTEDAPGGHKGLLRFDAGRFVGEIVRQATRHIGRIQGELRKAGPAGVDVSQLLGAGKRKAGASSSAKMICAIAWKRSQSDGRRPSSVKGVKLDASFDPSIPNFRFDYQKVQQAAANLLDNALKHTPAGGTVTLHAGPHFWERRVAEVAPIQERRRFRLPRPNSVEVSVADSGPGIPAEHHQEIFEDFVRVDRNTTGMGLGLGNCEAVNPGASRKNMGRERAGRRKQVYVPTAHGPELIDGRVALRFRTIGT